MADDKYFGKSGIVPTIPDSRLQKNVELPQNYDGPSGVGSAIASYSRRRAITQYKKELLAISEAYRAGEELNKAREAFIASQVRLGRNNLEKIALREEAKVAAELAEEEMRLASVLRKQETFGRQAEIEDKRLKNDSLLEDLRRQQIEEQLYGKKGNEGLSIAEQKKALESEITELYQAVEKIDAEYLNRSEAGTVNDAFEGSYNSRRNRLKDKLDSKIAEEEAL